MTRMKIVLATAIAAKLLCSDYTAYRFLKEKEQLTEDKQKLTEQNAALVRQSLIHLKQAEYLAQRFGDAGLGEEFDIIALKTIPEMI